MRTSSICKKLSICIIHSDPASLKNIVDIVKIMGCGTYMHFSSIHDAINEYEKFYKGRSPDLIISEWCNYFIGTPYFESKIINIPIAIVITPEESNIENSILDECKNVKAFLVNPVDIGKLSEVIRKIFRKKFLIQKK